MQISLDLGLSTQNFSGNDDNFSVESKKKET